MIHSGISRTNRCKLLLRTVPFNTCIYLLSSYTWFNTASSQAPDLEIRARARTRSPQEQGGVQQRAPPATIIPTTQNYPTILVPLRYIPSRPNKASQHPPLPRSPKNGLNGLLPSAARRIRNPEDTLLLPPREYTSSNSSRSKGSAVGRCVTLFRISCLVALLVSSPCGRCWRVLVRTRYIFRCMALPSRPSARNTLMSLEFP